MFIKRLNIESLGLLKNKDLTNLTSGVNAIVGDNGAGKSTTRHALGFSLFGIPAAKSKEDPRINPSFYSEATKTRRLNVTVSDGEEDVKVIRESLDKSASGDPLFQPESHKHLFAEYLGDVSYEDFSNIWSMSEFDLRNIDPAQSDTIRKVLASRYGVVSDPVTVCQNISSLLDNHTSEAKGKTGLSAAVRDFNQIQKRQTLLSARSQSAFEANSRLEELTNQIKTQEAQRTILRKTSDEKAKTLAEFENIARSKESAEQELQRAQLDLDALRQQKPTEPQKDILAKESSINIHEGRLGDFFAKQQNLSELKQRKSELNLKLSAFPQTSFSFTEADSALVAQEADRLRDIRRDTENNLYTQRAHVEEIKLQLENLRDSLPEPVKQSSSSHHIVLISITLVICFAAAAFFYFQNQSILMTGVIAAIGVVLSALELALLRGSKSQKCDNTPSPLSALEATLETEKVQLAVLDRAHDKALADWDAFIAHYFPAHKDLPFDEMYRHIKNLPEKIKFEQERDSLLQEITTKTQTIQAEEQEYNFLYKICFPENGIEDPHDVSTLITQCKMRLTQELKARDALTAYQAREKELISLAESAKKRLDGAVQHMDSIALQQQSSLQDVATNLMQAQANLRAQLQELDSSISHMSRDKGVCEETLRTSVSQDEIDQVQAQLQEQIGTIKAKAREMCVIQIATKLIEDALESFQKTKAPEIVRESNAIFKRITEGAYIRVLFPHEDDSDGLRVIDKEGNEFTPDMLSVGTMRQLYLAIRLAVITTQDQQSANLPVIFDEVLSSFDESRRASAALEINKIAREHQVFYFSVRKDFLDATITKDWNYIDLNNGRIDTNK